MSRASSAPWLARKDADWRLDELYDFVGSLGATLVRTSLSRSIIDVNRDPSGASLYPGQATTELCPTTTFDGEPLYPGDAPDPSEIAERRRAYFDPYHAALSAEIARLKARFARVALFDAHSIRSRIPRLFDGELPVFNLGHERRRELQPEAAGSARRGARGERAGALSSTAASGAAGSPAAMESRARGSKRSSSSSPAAPICSSLTSRRPPTGRSRSTPGAPPAPARRCGCAEKFWRRS